ncbi:MAG: hypothetical protein WA624_01785 [Methylocella sp.]
MILLEPRAKGIMGTTLHHNYEVRSDSVYFDDIPDLEIGEELLDRRGITGSRVSHHRDEKSQV